MKTVLLGLQCTTSFNSCTSNMDNYVVEAVSLYWNLSCYSSCSDAIASVVNFSGHFTCCITKHLNSRRCCYKCIWLGRWYKGSQKASSIKSHCCLSALFYTLLILPSVMCMYCLFMLHRIMSGYIFMLQGELSLNANFYLRDNSNRTVSFESVAFPSVFLAIQDGTTFLKEFSIFTVVRNSESTW